MSRLRSILLLGVAMLGLATPLQAQLMDYEIKHIGSGEGGIVYDFKQHTASGTNWVMVRYGGAVLTAERVTWYYDTGVVTADGSVRIQRDDQIWASEHIAYNFVTRE